MRADGDGVLAEPMARGEHGPAGGVRFSCELDPDFFAAGASFDEPCQAEVVARAGRFVAADALVVRGAQGGS